MKLLGMRTILPGPISCRVSKRLVLQLTRNACLLTSISETQISLFWDEKKFGFFSTPANQPDILLRLKDALDNSEPSTNGLSAQNLFRLSSLLEDAEYAKLASKTTSAFEAEILQHPFLFTSMMESIVAVRLGWRSIVVTGEGEDIESVVKHARSNIKGRQTIARLKSNGGWLQQRNPLLKELDATKARVQVCESGTCRLLENEALGTLFQ